MPSRITVAHVIGSRFATPRIPSVPNKIRPFVIAYFVGTTSRRLRRDQLDVFGGQSLTDARRHTFEHDLCLTRTAVARDQLDVRGRLRVLYREQRAGQRDVDL